MAQYLHRRSLGPPGAAEGVPASALDFPVGLGAIGEFLTRSEWDDGGKRVTGSITFFCDEGVLKVCLQDKDANAIAFCTGSSWAVLLENIEVGLREDVLDWRRNKPMRKGR